MKIPVVPAVLAAFGLAAAPAAAQESRSSAPARELAALLASRHASAIAAKDPDAPDRYVAALCFPDVQLLVVAAPYPSPAVLDDAIARKDYQTVYGALQSPTIKDGKVFFQDMGADGLRGKGEGAVDVLYERVTEQTLFGDASGRRKTGTSYVEKLTAADALYSRLLTVLLAQARGQDQIR